MTLINLRQIGVTLGAPLFETLSLTLGAGDRLGLVAANGKGKSTLLRCLAGTMDPSSGEITRARGLLIGHVEQDAPSALLDQPLRDAVLQALPAEDREADAWRADVTLDLLEIPSDLWDRPLAQLSGGWRRLALLARVWVTEPDLLLLDEPTNHLDLARILQMERFLAGLPRDLPVVIASHDRAFLDATTNRTLFLRPERSVQFALPYSRARAALVEADLAEEKRHQRDLKDAQQLRRQAAKLNNLGINSGSDLLLVKTKQLKQRADQLEEAARPAHQERGAGVVKLANRGTHAKVLLTLNDHAVETPDGRLLFKTGKLFLNQGDRVIVLGKNGSGKSRLISLIRAAILNPDPTNAAIKATPSLVLGHSDQTLSDLDDQETPLRLICRKFEGVDQRARALLAGAGIVVGMQEKRIGALSGGQKARLAMLVLRLTNPNFYLLDEPTNHLDIEGQEALESELMTRETSGLLASHDRSFVRAVGTRFWLIEKRRLIEVEGPDALFDAVAR
jgi:ATPase subunit of ABC transporter with duplicated ATPase domains